MIDKLIRALSKEEGMSVEEIADTIWLALQIQESPSKSVASDFSLVKEDIEANENKIASPKSQPQTPDSNETRKDRDSEDVLMHRIPWHLWDFLQDYKLAETAIGLPEANQVLKLNIVRKKIRILAICGDDRGINLNADKQYL
ncbi:MAG: hypothetical protein F6K22_11330 [Okeania sp. SIO2F4]|uniref:hypothetical protein n=1 Tax=Okeania sp. SIO2F4 TaxID=2607790 RepID=UPI00142A96DA|nr:hypothetical protein [Okeania sp. SIO2F4]NES03382.1 hypothetical protein [Okeania sp. SIO2F4]